MLRDPFYRQIEARLSGLLDANLFERCACDIINKDGLHVAPIPGGNDYGMDGAIADWEDVPFPLVCTISNDVSGNLKRNIKRYIKMGGTRRKVMVSTPRQLTPKRRWYLEKCATELGFTLIECYDRARLVRLLYQSPLWCRDLLGLTGDLPALSIFPRSMRHSFDIPLIGRDGDLERLISIEGDRLLVGQPGSGKTFLLAALARENDGAFVVSDDIVAISASFRELHPSILIIDDAFQRKELITSLLHYRRETGAGFAIIASCWPSDRYLIENTLALSSSAIHMLCPLIIPQMADIVRHAGVAGPDELVGEILARLKVCQVWL